MAIISSVYSRWILDSRGNPTIQCTVELDQQGKKISATASVPSGASTGKHEALELRDEQKEFHGKGVSKAISNINQTIAENIVGKDFATAADIDELIIKLENSPNKTNLGANSVLGVSMAAHRAFANLSGIELWQYLRRLYFSDLPLAPKFPQLMCNVLNGGAHANNNLAIQEFMIIPQTGEIESDVQAASEIYHDLKNTLSSDGYSTALGDEGGFAPKFNLENIVNSQKDDSENPENIELKPSKIVLNYLNSAIEKSGYSGTKMALDCAANEFMELLDEEGNPVPSEDIKYKIDNSLLSRSELADYYMGLIQDYPIVSIEDGYGEDDILGWEILTETLGKKISLIGDDLFVTNPHRFQKIGLENQIANGVLIKLNQIGSVSETCQMINLAKENNYVTSVSHRSGETTDSFISDLAFAAQSEFIKLGAPARGERVVKYNRLLEIKDSL